MPDPNQIRTASRAAIANMTGKNVKDDEALISSGLIDSLSILKLISQLEKSLAVAIPPENLQPDDFETVNEIVETVLRVAEA
jgi:acyl carrier protein